MCVRACVHVYVCVWCGVYVCTYVVGFVDACVSASLCAFVVARGCVDARMVPVYLLCIYVDILKRITNL